MKLLEDKCQTIIRTGIEQLAQMVERDNSGVLEENRIWQIRYNVFRYRLIIRDWLRVYAECCLLVPLFRSNREGRSMAYARLRNLAELLARHHPAYRWLMALERAIEEAGIEIETKYFDGGFSKSEGRRILIRPFMSVRARFRYLVIEYVYIKLRHRNRIYHFSTVGNVCAEAVAYAVARAVGLECRYFSRMYIACRGGDHEYIQAERQLATKTGAELLRSVFRQMKASSKMDHKLRAA